MAKKLMESFLNFDYMAIPIMQCLTKMYISRCHDFKNLPYLIPAEELSQTPEASPELTKRSWFGSLMSTDRDETYTIIVKEKPLASIKADLVQAFLSVRSKSR